MLSPTLCVYWILEYVDISNLPEKGAFVKPAEMQIDSIHSSYATFQKSALPETCDIM
jgi:hypothetical protein